MRRTGTRVGPRSSVHGQQGVVDVVEGESGIAPTVPAFGEGTRSRVGLIHRRDRLVRMQIGRDDFEKKTADREGCGRYSVCQGSADNLQRSQRGTRIRMLGDRKAQPGD